MRTDSLFCPLLQKRFIIT